MWNTILFNDEIGGQFLDVLIEKAKQGVEVRLIFDPWGSPKANRKILSAINGRWRKRSCPLLLQKFDSQYTFELPFASQNRGD